MSISPDRTSRRCTTTSPAGCPRRPPARPDRPGRLGGRPAWPPWPAPGWPMRRPGCWPRGPPRPLRPPAAEPSAWTGPAPAPDRWRRAHPAVGRETQKALLSFPGRAPKRHAPMPGTRDWPCLDADLPCLARITGRCGEVICRAARGVPAARPGRRAHEPELPRSRARLVVTVTHRIRAAGSAGWLAAVSLSNLYLGSGCAQGCPGAGRPGPDERAAELAPLLLRHWRAHSGGPSQ